MPNLKQILLTDIKDIIKMIYDNEFSRLYNAGVDAYQKGDVTKAIDLFLKALNEKKVKPQVYYNLGLSYQSIKNYDKAASSYRKFLELNPNDYDGIYNIALVYFAKENYALSIELFEKSMQLKKEVENVKSLILALICNGEIQKAVDFAENILETSANGIDLYFNIAKVFEGKNSFNKDFTLLDIAMEMYSKITQLDAEHFESYLAKSICFAKKGEWENSVNNCEKALEINPKSYDANNQMGLVYYCCDLIEESVKYYEKALELNPKNDYKIYSNLGYAYEKLGENQKAIKIFSKLVSNFANFPAKDEIKNHLRILKTL